MLNDQQLPVSTHSSSQPKGPRGPTRWHITQPPKRMHSRLQAGPGKAPDQMTTIYLFERISSPFHSRGSQASEKGLDLSQAPGKHTAELGVKDKEDQPHNEISFLFAMIPAHQILKIDSLKS